VNMPSTAEIATSCFFMKFIDTFPLVTASFSLGYVRRYPSIVQSPGLVAPSIPTGLFKCGRHLPISL
jgi:hypothetical protein